MPVAGVGVQVALAGEFGVGAHLMVGKVTDPRCAHPSPRMPAHHDVPSAQRVPSPAQPLPATALGPASTTAATVAPASAHSLTQ